MSEKCKDCGIEWESRYRLAVARFDNALSKAVCVSLVSVIIALICVISLVAMAIRTQHFISQFEYVEETEYVITQDDGVNTAIISDRGSEVNLYADNQEDYTQIFQKEE